MIESQEDRDRENAATEIDAHPAGQREYLDQDSAATAHVRAHDATTRVAPSAAGAAASQPHETAARPAPAAIAPEPPRVDPATSLSDVLREGGRIGKYEIVYRRGKGAMGTVYKAIDTSVRRREVAIKVLAPWLASHAQIRARFHKEAESIALIDSPNVVKLHDFGLIENVPFAGDVPYIVMDYLHGEELSARLKQSRLTTEEMADLLLEVARGVQDAHDVNVIHRDLKPSNIFIQIKTSGWAVKVVDFSISTANDDPRLTAEGVVVGTNYYLAPERARGRSRGDERSDQYALGVIAYECVTGRRPFRGTATEVLRAVAMGEFEPIRSIRPETPEALEELIHRAMNVDPSLRFPSVKAFGAALLKFASPPAQRRHVDYFTAPVVMAQIPLSGPMVASMPIKLPPGRTETASPAGAARPRTVATGRAAAVGTKPEYIPPAPGPVLALVPLEASNALVGRQSASDDPDYVVEIGASSGGARSRGKWAGRAFLVGLGVAIGAVCLVPLAYERYYRAPPVERTERIMPSSAPVLVPAMPSPRPAATANTPTSAATKPQSIKTEAAPAAPTHPEEYANPSPPEPVPAVPPTPRRVRRRRRVVEQPADSIPEERTPNHVYIPE